MPILTDQNTYRHALQNLLCCRPVAYYSSLARAVGGVCPALMLSQLLYWHGVKAGEIFFKSVAEMTAETGLSPDEQATARKHLIDCGAVTAKRSGWPATWHYQVNLDRIAELLNSPLSSPQIPTLPESGNARIRQRQIPAKPAERFRQNRNLSEGAINELKEEITTETTGEEEEGPDLPTFQNLDAQIIDELLNFGVFQSKLPEIDQAGWPPDQLRELMAKCRQQDRRGTPAALLLKRIKEQRPPMPPYGYPQYNEAPDEPTSPSLRDLVLEALDRALKPSLGGDLNAVMGLVDVSDFLIEPDEINPESDNHVLILSCPLFVWDKYIKPCAESILAAMEPLGLNSIRLAA